MSEDGQPVANAIIDVWHSDAEGFYDVQLPELEEPTLRARFHSDAQGRFRFWTIMPKFYPIPDDGTVGEMLKASARHPYRPAHVHFMIVAGGHETLVTHVFVDGDQYLDSDAVFAVKNSLIRDFTREAPGIAPDGKKIDTPWRKLQTDFVLSMALAEEKRASGIVFTFPWGGPPGPRPTPSSVSVFCDVAAAVNRPNKRLR